MYYVCKNQVLCDEEGDKKEASSTIVRKLAIQVVEFSNGGYKN
jgi:hypothetical protein